ncbi:MAG: GNAT family N-acetyltransferase [Anaerolineae bacterium]|nr:GNAT family N-acetyltransferase [Anaerolineae bacterium]
MNPNALNELNEKRREVRRLLSPADPADALTSYYALWHDPRRTQITLHRDAQGHTDGFLVVAQTGADLFRPLVVLRAPHDDAPAAQGVVVLMRSVLAPNRPYQVIVPLTLASAVRRAMTVTSSRLTYVYRLDPARFEPVINVLVRRVDPPGDDNPPGSGNFRFEIESQGQVMAMSGTNWRSPVFAEVFVYVHPRARGRGWGRSVVSACSHALLEERLRPLYMVEEGNSASQRIAEALGYADTGMRNFVGEGQLAA